MLPNDTGTYECVRTNLAGAVRGSLALTVLPYTQPLCRPQQDTYPDIIKYFKIFYVADSSKVGKTMLVTLSFLLIGVFVMMAFTLYYFKKHKVISIHHIFIKISIYCKYF